MTWRTWTGFCPKLTRCTRASFLRAALLSQRAFLLNMVTFARFRKSYGQAFWFRLDFFEKKVQVSSDFRRIPVDRLHWRKRCWAYWFLFRSGLRQGRWHDHWIAWPCFWSNGGILRRIDHCYWPSTARRTSILLLCFASCTSHSICAFGYQKHAGNGEF